MFNVIEKLIIWFISVRCHSSIRIRCFFFS